MDTRVVSFFCPLDNGWMTRRTATKQASETEPEPRADEPSARVLRQFRQIFNAVKTHFQQVEREVGLGGAQVWALGLIRDNRDIGVSDLARAMNIHQSTASNLVKVLVERELVTTAKDTGDRRAVKLKLLPAGARMFKKSPGPLAGVLPEALESLDPKTLKRREDDLAKLLTVLKTDKRAAKIPLAQL